MSAPVLLDLFCGAGGAGEGYARAGFRVVGVDLDPKPLRHNPHECYQGDALAVLDALLAGEEWQGYRLEDFDALVGSPPCQDASVAAVPLRRKGKQYPKLIEPTRQRFVASGLPYIIENVPGAKLYSPIMLCGSMFGLKVRRHRLFESPALSQVVTFTAASCRHDYIPVTVAGHGSPSGVRKRIGRVGPPVSEQKVAMGIDWMNRDELSQAIPPAYTAWLGNQLMSVVSGGAA